MKAKKLLLFCGIIGVMAITTNAFAISSNTLNVPELTAAPTVDGTLDATWSSIPALQLSATSTANYTATVRTAWKGTKLYFFISVLDDVVNFSRGTAGYQGSQDVVNIYLNLASDFATSTTYTAGTHQYRFNIKNDGDAEQFDGRYAGNWDFSGLPAGGKELVSVLVAGGYNIETSIDLSVGWNYYSMPLGAGKQFAIGFASEDYDGAAQSSQNFWSADGNSWGNPTALATATLSGTPPPPPPPPPASQLNVYQLSADVTVDGTLDATWASIPALPIVLNSGGTEVAQGADYTVTVRTAWRGTKLYFFISVLDDQLVFLRGGQGYGVQDNVNIYLNLASDFATATATGFTSRAHQYRINIKNDTGAEQFDGRYAGDWNWPGHNSFDALPALGKELVTSVVAGGYNIETSLDLSVGWNYQNAPIAAEKQFAVGFEASDYDNTSIETQLFWGADGNSYDNTSKFKAATFKAANGTTGVAPELNADAPKSFAKNGVLYFQNIKNVNQVSVKSITGQEVKTLNVSSSVQTVENLKTGIYLVTFKGQKTTTQKVVVQ